MDDHQESSEATQTSGYNEAVFQIQRLNELWIKAELFANRGFFKKWQGVLDSIYRELISDIEKMKNSKEIKKKNFIFLKYIANSQKKEEKYFYIDRRHQFIKVLQDSCGKGSIYRDADDEDLD